MKEFVSIHGYPLLSICLHSATFRNALSAADPEDQDNDRLTWNDRLNLIIANAASLEFFAKARSLNWRAPIFHHDSVYSRIDEGISAENEGWSVPSTGADAFLPVSSSMRERHHLASSEQLHPHSHAIMADGSAQRQHLTYRASASLERTHGAATHARGTHRTDPHENLSDYIVLGDTEGYRWPNLDNFPERDPMYAGVDNDLCAVCDLDRYRIQLDQAPTVPGTGRCQCAFADYKQKMAHPVEALVELVENNGMGVGVRALQDIEKGQLIGIYYGEAYPRGGTNRARYADVDGAYTMESGYGFGGLRPKKRKTSLEEREEDPDYDSRPVKKRKANKKTPAKSGKNPSGKSAVKKATKQAAQPGASDSSEENRGNDDADEEIGPKFSVDAALKGNFARYINHSCDGSTRFHKINIGQRQIMTVEAMRAIKFGEEITIYYGEEYFVNSGFAC